MRRVLFILAALLFFSPPAFANTEEAKLRDAVKTGKIIRLHVIAAGDDAENQRIKLCVRDKVLASWRDALSNQENLDDVMAFLEENREALKEDARRAALMEGFSGNVSAQVGVFPFPDRWYGNVLVPAGDYKALRIVLGDGSGKNWWCVLFPTLCLSLAQEQPPEDTSSEDLPFDGETSFEWWVRDIFCCWPLLTSV